MLTRDLLERVFAGIDWEAIRRQSGFPTAYNGYPATAMIAAHTLPYCLPLPSERALARELSEHEFVQRLCGFAISPGNVSVPTRATLWHFRTRHYGSFQKALIRGLTALVAQSRDLHFDLPFESSVERAAPERRDVSDSFELNYPQVHAEVSAAQPPSREPRPVHVVDAEMQLRMRFLVNSEGDQDALYDTAMEADELDVAMLKNGRRHARERVGLAEHVGLPAQVNLHLPKSAALHMWFEAPGWLYADLQEKDRLTELGPSYETRPYAACNILVRRTIDHREHVLLARRLTGSGKGEFALPGGKRGAEETIQQCAKRELKEETGLEMCAGRPVSCHRRRASNGGPLVTSVGILAEATHGDPSRREEQHHSEWIWYPISELPEPIFAPARLVLDAYKDGNAPLLTWEHVEDASDADQPSLFEPVIPTPD